MKGQHLNNVLCFVLDSVPYPKKSLANIWSEVSSRAFWHAQFNIAVLKRPFLFRGLFAKLFFLAPSKCKFTLLYLFVFIYQREHIMKSLIMNPFLIPAPTQFPSLKQGEQRNFTFLIVHSFLLWLCPFLAYLKFSILLGQVTEETGLIDLLNYL